MTSQPPAENVSTDDALEGDLHYCSYIALNALL